MFLAPITAWSNVGLSAEKFEKEIQAKKSAHFDTLIKGWEKTYGPNAVSPLLQIAKDKKKVELNRYIALMGAAKIGGQAVLPQVLPLLRDPSWMLRSGTLRMLSLLGTAETAKAAIPLVHDPALVVRAEAIETLRTLKPTGAADALFQALENPENYHRGKALWVPQKALLALVAIQAREITPKLTQFLKTPAHQGDVAFLKLVRTTLQDLSQK